MLSQVCLSTCLFTSISVSLRCRCTSAFPRVSIGGACENSAGGRDKLGVSERWATCHCVREKGCVVCVCVWAHDVAERGGGGVSGGGCVSLCVRESVCGVCVCVCVCVCVERGSI